MSSFPPRPPARRCWLPLVFLLLLSGPLAAQSSRRYWEANPDSLHRVLATQHADTARLRTLLHLLDRGLTHAERQEAQALATRLGRPEARALQLLPGTLNPNNTDYAYLTAQRDSLKAAIAAFDRLSRPVPQQLTALTAVFTALNQTEELYRYVQAQLRTYQARGAVENLAACQISLDRYFFFRGDYNQAISHSLQAAELYRTFDRIAYYSPLMITGARYVRWGNPAKALSYLQLALRAPRRGRFQVFIYQTIAQLRLQQHDYPAALNAVDQSLRVVDEEQRAGLPPRRYQKPQGLVLKSAVLLALKRPAEAGRLLQQAQELDDSLHLPLFGRGINFELEATWARYYAATGNAARAEKAWLAAYRRAQAGGTAPQRLQYLRGLAAFYQTQGQFAPAARYYQAATALADTLETAQGALHVASYEYERAERAQTLRIAGLRETQLLDAASARRQRLLLWATLAGLALLAGLGFVLWRGNRRQQQANAQLQAQRDQTAQALKHLQTTQAQLIQKEKMASLGELTAGIAHEIQNPLNFVNNFSEVSSELVEELEEEQQRPGRDAALEAELLGDLKQNLHKITLHGRRAAGIVKGMLEHSSTSAGEREPTDLNRLCDEYLRLAYQGLRAKDKSFNAALSTDFLADLPPVTVVGADVGRVLLNLFTNAFYAVRQRQQAGEPGYQPQVGVRTVLLNQQVQIQVTDNGTGMTDSVKQKIFQPFFTTKPTGEGTGLGLSLSHDIIAQGHGGSLTVESREGEGTEFIISLPA
ncbi:ATP-binding protein [Hymenobacter siberiensis]|uniref:ATP-binding protein n=1 Tax=Hymenobacter siberiensis TaxID=2848396 RepID=UPI001D007F8A|nr:ATP-binding protein [Hymenobacter siberiensis]